MHPQRIIVGEVREQVVKANDQIVAAQHKARLAAVEATRNGLTGKKGKRG
jgi:hypothetical protein